MASQTRTPRTRTLARARLLQRSAGRAADISAGQLQGSRSDSEKKRACSPLAANHRSSNPCCPTAKDSMGLFSSTKAPKGQKKKHHKYSHGESMKHMLQDELREEARADGRFKAGATEIAIDDVAAIAKEAGDAIMAIYNGTSESDWKKIADFKADGSPLTKADTTANKICLLYTSPSPRDS